MNKYLHLEAAVRYIAENPNRGVKDGSVIEFGTFMGAGLEKLISLSNLYNINLGKIYGIDSFEGLPENNSNFPKFAKGEYNASNCHPDPINYIHDKLHYKNLVLIKRWYDQLDSNDVNRYNIKPAKLVIIDCDIYSSTKSALNWLYENKLLQKGTLIVFDEYEVEGNTSESTTEGFAWNELIRDTELADQTVWSWIFYDKTYGTRIDQLLVEIL